MKKGFFVEPTITTYVTASMQMWTEIFGPVLCKTIGTEEEAIELASNTGKLLLVWNLDELNL